MAKELDIVLCFDTTASMSPVLMTVRQRLRDLTSFIFNNMGADARVGVVAHGDYDSADTYVVQHLDLCAKSQETQLQNFITQVRGVRNGWNEGEAYEQALKVVKTLAWRPLSRKLLILVGDDKPHGPTFPANTEHTDWKIELQALTDMDIPVYAVQCASLDIARSQAFYQALANAHPRGVYIQLAQFGMMNELLWALLYHASDDMAGLATYEQSLQQNGQYNRNLEVAFNTLLQRQDEQRAAVQPQAQASSSGSSNTAAVPVPPGRFQRLRVQDKMSIKAFVEHMGALFRTGRGFYELSKPENVSATKEIVVEDIASGEMYSGGAARVVLGLPTSGTAKLQPSAVPSGKRVFVQSKSHTRGLLPNTFFLYEIDQV